MAAATPGRSPGACRPANAAIRGPSICRDFTFQKASHSCIGYACTFLFYSRLRTPRALPQLMVSRPRRQYRSVHLCPSGKGHLRPCSRRPQISMTTPALDYKSTALNSSNKLEPGNPLRLSIAQCACSWRRTEASSTSDRYGELKGWTRFIRHVQLTAPA